MKNLLHTRQGTNQYKKKRSYWKLYVTAYVVISALVMLLATYFKEVGRQEERERNGIILNFKAEAYEPVVIPTEEAQRRYEIKEIVRKISILESGAGSNTNPDALHNICKSQGKENQWGYGGMAMMICFDSFEEGQARIFRWFEEHLEKMTLDEALCVYNIGKKVNDCNYVANFKSL